MRRLRAQMFKILKLAILMSAACASAPHALAVTVIDFEELDNFDNYYDFYDGGFNLAGVQGPDLGITFSGGWAVRSAGNTSVTFDEIFGHISATVENGFSGGFAFRFALEISVNLTVVIGAADGQILASESFTAPPSGIGVDPVTGELFYEDWTIVGIPFDGVASYVSFDDNLCCVPVVILDDLTFGRTTLIPLPAAGWMFLAALSVGAGLVRTTRSAMRQRNGAINLTAF